MPMTEDNQGFLAIYADAVLVGRALSYVIHADQCSGIKLTILGQDEATETALRDLSAARGELRLLLDGGADGPRTLVEGARAASPGGGLSGPACVFEARALDLPP
jgi:hypothetical protein